MSLVVYSRSRSFEDHLNTVVEGEVKFRNKLTSPVAGKGNVYLIHVSSFSRELPDWLTSACQKGVVVGVADESPQLAGLLEHTQAGVYAYFNAYMSSAQYAQLLRLLGNGQSWFPPGLVSEAFDLARTAIKLPGEEDPLELLTKREREVALAVSEGKSNKLVASECDISERTVKTHLTHIFKKLQVKDRVALVIHLNKSGSIKAGHSSTG